MYQAGQKMTVLGVHYAAGAVVPKAHLIPAFRQLVNQGRLVLDLDGAVNAEIERRIQAGELRRVEPKKPQPKKSLPKKASRPSAPLPLPVKPQRL
jgi:hypothetical protein